MRYVANPVTPLHLLSASLYAHKVAATTAPCWNVQDPAAPIGGSSISRPDMLLIARPLHAFIFMRINLGRMANLQRGDDKSR